MSEGEIEAVADPARWQATFPPAEIAALDLATQLCHDSHALSEELVDRLRHYWDDRQLAELVMVAGQANMNNRVGSAAMALFGTPRQSCAHDSFLPCHFKGPARRLPSTQRGEDSS
jgi:alkylhydroperoxidase family enzyme